MFFVIIAGFENIVLRAFLRRFRGEVFPEFLRREFIHGFLIRLLGAEHFTDAFFRQRSVVEVPVHTVRL